MVRDYIHARAGKVIKRAELIKCGASETAVDVEVARLISSGLLTRFRRGQYTLTKAAPRTAAKDMPHH